MEVAFINRKIASYTARSAWKLPDIDAEKRTATVEYEKRRHALKNMHVCGSENDKSAITIVFQNDVHKRTNVRAVTTYFSRLEF